MTEPAAPLHPPHSPEQAALEAALGRLLQEAARLAVARGLPFAAAEDLLKGAFVQAAALANPGVPAHRNVSRISTATGINRREVTRLTQQRTRGQAEPAPRAARSVASAVFAHWLSQPPYRSPQGQALPLPRQGPEPSFETLAQQVTRDVHPRSLLEELCRLGMAALDSHTDTVRLLSDAYVPQGDRVRMLGFLGDNVGDHLSAAVDNVLVGDRTHFEQALFADGLSAASITSVRSAVTAQWQQLMAQMVPQLEALIAGDAQLDPVPSGRVRVGLYAFHEAQARAALQIETPGDQAAVPQPGKEP